MKKNEIRRSHLYKSTKRIPQNNYLHFRKSGNMTLTLKSTLRSTDGVVGRKSASNLFLFIDPNKLRNPYALKPLTDVFGKIISAEPSKINLEEETYNTMYESVSGLSVLMIFHPAYNDKDYLYLSKRTSRKLSTVGIIPNEFSLTVEIESFKSGLLSKKVYPKAQVYDTED